MKISNKVLMGSVAAAVALGAGSTLAFAGTGTGTGTRTASTQAASNQALAKGHFMRGPGDLMATLASELSLSTSQLQADFQAGKTVSEIASAKGISSSKLISDLETKLKANVSSDAERQASNLVNGPTKKKALPRTSTTMSASNSSQDSKHAWFGGRRGPWKGPQNDLMSETAAFLGLTTSELQTEMQSGKTIAQIAQAKGKSTDALTSSLESSLSKSLQGAVSSGKMTSTQEASLKQKVDVQITDFVNGKAPAWSHMGQHAPKKGFRIAGGNSSIMSALAADLDMSSATLQSDLKSGQTVSQIASAKNVSTTTLISKLEATIESQMTSRINQEVEQFVKSTTPPAMGHFHRGWRNSSSSSTTQTS